MKKDPTMSGQELPKTGELKSDFERGKVGQARWRSRKKQATAQYRRRVLDLIEIQKSIDAG